MKGPSEGEFWRDRAVVSAEVSSGDDWGTAADAGADFRISVEEPDESRWVAVLLIAVPIIIQVYFNSGLTYLLMKWLRVEHNVAAPGALIGASNFFELAVAVAITLFGSDSPAALATVVGVLVEAPVMLSVCNVCNRTRGWFGRGR
jgi:hypothetical protein